MRLLDRSTIDGRRHDGHARTGTADEPLASEQASLVQPRQSVRASAPKNCGGGSRLHDGHTVKANCERTSTAWKLHTGHVTSVAVTTEPANESTAYSSWHASHSSA